MSTVTPWAIRFLKSLAQRLEGKLAENEFIARIGDEFLAVKTIDEDGAADAFARRLITILSAPVHSDNRVLSVGASCGLAIYPDDGHSADELICAPTWQCTGPSA